MRILLSRMIGQGPSGTLDRYGHLFPGCEEAAADLLDAYLERQPARGSHALSAEGKGFEPSVRRRRTTVFEFPSPSSVTTTALTRVRARWVCLGGRVLTDRTTAALRSVSRSRSRFGMANECQGRRSWAAHGRRDRGSPHNASHEHATHEAGGQAPRGDGRPEEARCRHQPLRRSAPRRQDLHSACWLGHRSPRLGQVSPPRRTVAVRIGSSGERGDAHHGDAFSGIARTGAQQSATTPCRTTRVRSRAGRRDSG